MVVRESHKLMTVVRFHSSLLKVLKNRVRLTNSEFVGVVSHCLPTTYDTVTEPVTALPDRFPIGNRSLTPPLMLRGLERRPGVVAKTGNLLVCRWAAESLQNFRSGFDP